MAETEAGLVGSVHNVGKHMDNEEFSLYIKPLMNLCGSRNAFSEELLPKLTDSDC